MRSILLAAALAAGCAAAPARRPTSPRTLTIGLEPGWPSGHVALIREALEPAWLPGWTIRVVAPGQPADVTLRHADFGRCALAGLWSSAARAIYWDPVCTPGETVATHVLRHEALHALGARHTPRSRGLAVMNATFDLPRAEIAYDVACCDPPPIATELAPADVAELRRVGVLP